MSGKKSHDEDLILAAVVQHLTLRGVPGLVFIHVPQGNKLGGKRTKTGVPLQAIRNKRLGVRKGASDLLLWHGGHAYALELKTTDGRPRDSQRRFISDMIAAGAYADFARGIDEALATLEGWHLLR